MTRHLECVGEGGVGVGGVDVTVWEVEGEVRSEDGRISDPSDWRDRC